MHTQHWGGVLKNKEKGRGQRNCRQQKTKRSVLWKTWSLTLKWCSSTYTLQCHKCMLERFTWTEEEKKTETMGQMRGGRSEYEWNKINSKTCHLSFHLEWIDGICCCVTWFVEIPLISWIPCIAEWTGGTLERLSPHKTDYPELAMRPEHRFRMHCPNTI